MNNEPIDDTKCPACGGVIYYPIENVYTKAKCLDCGIILTKREHVCEDFVAKEKTDAIT